MKFALDNCKINHKDTEEISLSSQLPLVDDLYLADGYRGFAVSARRDSERRLCLSDELFDHVDINDRSHLRRYLFESSGSPCLLRTEIGTAVVFGDIFRSTYSFCFSFLKAETNGELYSAYAREGESLVILDSQRLSERGAGRPTTLSCDLERVVKNTTTAFVDPLICCRYQENIIDEKYKNKLAGIVELSGCDARFKTDRRLIFGEDVDHKLLSAFLVSSLLLCRRIGSERAADVTSFEVSDDPCVSVEFKTEGNVEGVPLPELECFLSVAERRGIYFDCLFSDSGMRILLSPVRSDPSVYGFKSREEFDWGGDFYSRLSSLRRKRPV